MLRLVRHTINFLLVAVVVAAAVNAMSDWLWSDIFTKTITSRVITTTVLALMIAASLLILRIEKRSQSQKEYRLIKRSEKLMPQDLNFEIVESGKTAASVTHRRPYTPGTYLQRSAVPYAQRQSTSTSNVQSESDLSQMLRKGKNLLLVGPPTAGKTRTLLELVDRLSGYIAVIPHHDAAPSESAIQLLRDKKVILLLDDLKNYETSAVKLIDLYRDIRDIAASCVMLATSRLGPDYMTAISYESGLGRLFENFDTYTLVPPTIEQQRNLARLLDQTFSEPVPTLGFISMRDVFELMQKRFDTLPTATQDCFRALQLLAAGGIEPYETPKVHIALKSVFGRNIDSASVRDALGELASDGFIAYSTKDAIHPHTAYLVGPAASMFYRDQALPESNLVELARCFHHEGDLRSANKVGLALILNGNRIAALDVWQKTLALVDGRTEPEIAEAEAHALCNIGVALGLTNDAAGEIATCDALLNKFGKSEVPRIASLVARAMAGKCRALSELGQFEKALEAGALMEQRFEMSEDLETQVCVARTRVYLANVHSHTKDRTRADAAYKAIVESYDETTMPELQEVLAYALFNQAQMLARDGQHDSANARYDLLIARFAGIKRPGMAAVIAQALARKASCLVLLEKPADATACLERLYQEFGTQRSPEKQGHRSLADRSEYAINASAINGAIAQALANLHAMYVLNGRRSEAERTFNELVKRFSGIEQADIKANIINSYRNRAADLIETGDYAAAQEAWRDIGSRFASDSNAETRQECASRLFSLAALLFKRYGRLDEAVTLFEYIVSLFKNDDAPGARAAVAGALVNISSIFLKSMRNEEAIRACEQAITLYGTSREPDLKALLDKAHLNRAIALGMMGVF